MKSVRTALTTLALSVIGMSSAFASADHANHIDTSLTYNSGILVLAFAGFLALVVVVQTIPAVISLYNMIKKTAEESSRQQQTVRANARD
ncbi:hypothetical protein SAMN02745119_01485 [Trichlorobacter thiogenes]|uniref:Uncharacterized protein n=1 Tax=Trichlorobacter thiogenes TaxID=115783 RepID=A0A1T4N2F2_9BACT|nr:hypothetical protein [Trichlorobacter thiogenes]SJZ73217.1 hypothetical protein SAMN02745119_01485 [Trichlorobacter thiogenes]